MLARIAAFEFRYQIASPLVRASALLLGAGAFADMAVRKVLTVGGGQVLHNSPHAIIMSHLLVSLLFLFLGAAIVSNVVVRDDQTGFGPILRSTPVAKRDYLIGRFAGAFAVAALVVSAATLGAWLGTLMPFADPHMMGPNRLSGFAYGLGLFALPNALIICAILFALATATRSTAGTFLGVIGLLVAYLVSQRLMEGQPDLMTLRVLADPFGMTAYLASSRYFTAADFNAGAVPVTDLILAGRLLWIGLALGLVAWTCLRFRLAERGPSRRQRRRLRKEWAAAAEAHAATPTVPAVPLVDQRFGRRTAAAQFAARTAMEAGAVVRSPAFAILLLIAFAFVLPGLLGAETIFGTPLYPTSAILIPILQGSFDTLLIVIATYYGGELVWRERERNFHEILDSAPVAAWAMMLPKWMALWLVLVATLTLGAAAAFLVQVLDGAVALSPGALLGWYLLPSLVEAAFIAALAIAVQTVSPTKYAGWGVMAVFILLTLFGPGLGLSYPLLIYGIVPDVPLSDMAGTGVFGIAAWSFRLFWAAVAALLLVTAHLLWPRGSNEPLAARLGRLPAAIAGKAGGIAVAATVLALLSGGWIIYNIMILNPYRSEGAQQRYLAEYERRYLDYARLPQPSVDHVELDVAIYPGQRRADVRGAYRLVNRTGRPIDRVHVRLANPNLKLVSLDFPAARLERDDPRFSYRIYRLEQPMQPGEVRGLAFRTRREQRGFRAAGNDSAITANGTDLDSFDLTPRIGMNSAGLIDDPVARRRLGLPPASPLPRLEDLAAASRPSADHDWAMADIRVSTRADQMPIATGRRLSDEIVDGRRIARFRTDRPVLHNLAIQSARYAVRTAQQDGVGLSLYFDPAHGWNVDRMLRAMKVATAYYRSAFGPYPHAEVRLVETPAYRDGGHAYPGMFVAGENAGFTMDLRDPATLDLASTVVAHELAHQWWGQQVRGARMQGVGLLVESLAQYSALMVMKRIEGEAKVRRLLQFQRDRYFSGRRTETGPERPLARVELNQPHIAYAKGALALYLLQQRIGEDAVNRALRRFVERYRFAPPPYPRSTDLVALLRQEASPADQALITDLFEKITLFDLRVGAARAERRPDGRWDVILAVTARKFHTDGMGGQRAVPLDQPLPIALYSGDPRSERNAVPAVTHWPRVRSGTQQLRFVTRTPPTHVVIDPGNLHLDRDSSDNIGSVTAPAPPQPDRPS